MSQTQYFKHEKSRRHGHPISAYSFILYREILFTKKNNQDSKNNKDIKILKVLGNTFLYTAYDTTFFFKNLCLIKTFPNTISFFSSFPGLKQKLSKCKGASI